MNFQSAASINIDLINFYQWRAIAAGLANVPSPRLDIPLSMRSPVNKPIGISEAKEGGPFRNSMR
jgi:hypothetical protein